MARIYASVFLALAVLGAGPARGAGVALAARVVLLVNRDDPDSLAIARHYADVRGVPRANILSFSMPLKETISWAEFVQTVWQPAQDELIRRHWIDAAPTALIDEIGRRKYAISGHRIAALVVCRGVPLRIDDDPKLYVPVPPLTDHGEMRTNAGAVDSELSLLARSGGYPINAYVPNPLFGRDRPGDRALAEVVKVSRLDGPTPADALGLVDRAVTAERLGLVGRAYVVMGGPYAGGNRWLERTAAQIAALGFDASVDRESGALAATARCDAPALYFGWHAPDLAGPFALPGFRFPPGAIALHIHSFSASTLRSPTAGWCGPLVARGVAATLGNVFEPYLELTPRPDLFFRALARGDTLVDADYYALPVLSWQCVLIGDPLYRPFAVPLKDELKNLDGLPPELAGYPVLRWMNLLDAERLPNDAIAVARKALQERKGLLALSLALARRLQAAGKPEEAARAVEAASGFEALAPDQWALARDAAQFLVSVRRPEEAVKAYRELFKIGALPPEVRATWLVEARKTALAANDPGQAAAWQKELDAVVAEMLPPKG